MLLAYRNVISVPLLRGNPGTAYAGLLLGGLAMRGCASLFLSLIRTENFGKREHLLFQDRSRRLTIYVA
jgi:hypothetical protein